MSPQERTSPHDRPATENPPTTAKNAAGIQASDPARVFVMLITKTVIALSRRAKRSPGCRQSLIGFDWRWQGDEICETPATAAATRTGVTVVAS